MDKLDWKITCLVGESLSLGDQMALFVPSVSECKEKFVQLGLVDFAGGILCILSFTLLGKFLRKFRLQKYGRRWIFEGTGEKDFWLSTLCSATLGTRLHCQGSTLTVVNQTLASKNQTLACKSLETQAILAWRNFLNCDFTFHRAKKGPITSHENTLYHPQKK